MRKPLVMEGAALGTALVIFLALTLYRLELPGLYYDEAADAVLAVQMLQGQPVEIFKGAGLWLGDMAYPLMVMDYVGAVNSYLLVPFFAVLGIGVESLRLLTVLGSAAAVVLTYFLARSLFGWAAAALAVLLLAVHPSFVFWSRQGIYVTSLMAPLALGGLLSLRRWHAGGNFLKSGHNSRPGPGPRKDLLSGQDRQGFPAPHEPKLPTPKGRPHRRGRVRGPG
ncbi:MAG: glycosyltransferase family 39 protein [Dehalococcoidia bacterium]|nr:glycosyltransferase family 39 protein [Dehalococcoidia bacterium]